MRQETTMDGRSRTSNPAKALMIDIASKMVPLKAYLDTSAIKHIKPGDYVLRMPQEQREILKTLKSDDIADVRPNPFQG